MRAGAIATLVLALGCQGERIRGCKERTIATLEGALVERGIERQLANRVLTDERLECYPIDYSVKNQPEFSLSKQEYVRLFLATNRIKRAKKNLKKYAKWFQAAEKKYGVPKEVIAAIIEMESKSGQNSGKYNAPSAFASVFQNRPEKKKWVVRELAALLDFAMKNRRDPFMQSSRSGAIGIAQFLPTTINAYAVDADGRGFDPFSMPDAILSIAHFLYKMGWQRKRWDAVRRFNHSDNYEAAVQKLASALK